MSVWAVLGLLQPAWAGVSASSEITVKEDPHLAKHAVDGLLSTGWAESEDGDGTGGWLELDLGAKTDVSSVSIWPGRVDQGRRGLREYGRPHTVTVTLTGGGEEVTQQVRVLDIAETGPTRVDVPIKGSARRVRITLDEVYVGGIHNDTYITEVAVNYTRGAGHSTLQKLADWSESKAAVKSKTEHTERIAELQTTLDGSEFGDRDALAELKSAASDGAPYLRERVGRYVADGFRMIALPPDPEAMNALLALEDPNGIPALELAATRATGDLQAALQDRASRLGALQDIKGGGKRNVKAFGESGFSKGCLQSFGEPLGVAVDNFGGVWVADLGNHRIQRFDFNGISQQVIGKGKPAISNQWLAKNRDWYAAGAESGSELGAFTLPLDVETVPNKKEGDGLVVLDAAGRITRFDGASKVQTQWAIGVDSPVSPGVGGEGHVVVAGKNVVAAWGNEVFVYDMDGQAIGSFELEEGVTTGLVGFKNGKIGAQFAETMVLYSADGFRHGEVLAGTIPDGFEYWDAALDEKGKLWIVTDHGFAIKYKKPGKVDYQVRFAEYSLGVPRVDVYQDVLFITDRDAILKVDALEKNAQDQLESAGEEL